MKLTRRQLAATLAAGGAIRLPAEPQAPADELKAARDRLKANADTLNTVILPMAVEPAFQFKA